jgi:hippurate hydrolase
LQDGLKRIAAEVGQNTGCKLELSLGAGYPAVMNPPELYGKVRTMVSFRELEAPSMITEDFSWYQRTVPGLFFFLGTGDNPALHSDNFDFPEGILISGADFFEKIAEAYA